MKIIRFYSLIFLICFIHSSFSFSQSVPRVRLIGTVIDASTGESLHFTNVFLSNTMKGAATDETGYFSIVNVPLGTYELIASMIGYETEVIIIKLTEVREYVFQIKLNPKAIEAPSLEVTSRIPRKWKKNLKRFENLLFGETENSKQCKILNPELLNFDEDDEIDSFIATTGGPLKIENRALGYLLTFYLKKLSLKDGSVLSTSGHVLFEPLNPANEKDQKRWKKNRLKSYHGSMRHFLIALVSNRLTMEGFYVKNDIHRYRRDRYIHMSNVTSHDLVSEGQRKFEKEILFEDYLRVVYTKEETPMQRRGRVSYKQTSWLKIIHGSPVIINELGLLSNPEDIMQYGYWAEQRLADELPCDYVPRKE